jgi:hypothetical protein
MGNWSLLVSWVLHLHVTKLIEPDRSSDEIVFTVKSAPDTREFW